jgi:hypothetical protein
VSEPRFYKTHVVCGNCGCKSCEVLWRGVPLSDIACAVCDVKGLRRDVFSAGGDHATEQDAVEAGLIEYPGEVG